MKILVFEFISGGGFSNQMLPDGLAREGRLMLQALLDSLSCINAVEMVVMVDWRFENQIIASHNQAIIIKPEHDYRQQFLRLAQNCDAVWPIAPESDGLLQQLCQIAADLGKILLTAPAAAVALAGDKYHTYQRLCHRQIAAIPTQLLADSQYRPGAWMIKALDGAGCGRSYLVTEQQDYQHVAGNAENYIIQPHVPGKTTSLSCLFKQGRAWLLSVNLQQFDLIGNQYRLRGITVNYQTDMADYQKLAQDIAAAIPDLWGYAGVDLIEADGQLWVLEINPRLTTAFAAINQALGVNVAEQVLRLLHGDPCVQATKNLAVNITL